MIGNAIRTHRVASDHTKHSKCLKMHSKHIDFVKKSQRDCVMLGKTQTLYNK